MNEQLRRLEGAVIEAVDRQAALDAGALLYLLRLYELAGRADLVDTIGQALARALLEYGRASTIAARAGWLGLFIETRHLTDDPRVQDAIAKLAAELKATWADVAVADAAAALGAVLRTAALPEFRALAAPAIDELERVIGRCYRPGHGLGAYPDEVFAASALLAAYELSDRLPYSMLAEELMQAARRCAAADFETSCEAARVYCRLADLHDDEEYRARAVVSPNARYRDDAARLLATLSAEARHRGAAGAIYGVALLELESPREPEYFRLRP